MEKQSEQQKTNELLEKLIVVQLRGQGVGQNQIAKFLGKRTQAVTGMLQTLKGS
jgi:hypothetical protein